MIKRRRSAGRINDVLMIEAIWTRIHQPRAVNFMQMVSYTIAFLFGIALVFFQPEGITDVAGTLTTVLLGVALTAASGTAAASCYSGAWWLERVGLLCIIAGYVGLFVVIIFMESLSDFMKMAVILSVLDAIAALLRRHYSIRWAYLDPAQ